MAITGIADTNCTENDSYTNPLLLQFIAAACCRFRQPSTGSQLMEAFRREHPLSVNRPDAAPDAVRELTRGVAAAAAAAAAPAAPSEQAAAGQRPGRGPEAGSRGGAAGIGGQYAFGSGRGMQREREDDDASMVGPAARRLKLVQDERMTAAQVILAC